MKNGLLLIACLLMMAGLANAQIKISALPTLTAPDSSGDYIPIVHSGTTYKVTPGKLFHEFGAPSGDLAQTQYQMVYGSGTGITSSPNIMYYDQTSEIDPGDATSWLFVVTDPVSTTSALSLSGGHHAAVSTLNARAPNPSFRSNVSLWADDGTVNSKKSYIVLSAFSDEPSLSFNLNAIGKQQYSAGTEKWGLDMLTDTSRIHLASKYLQLYGTVSQQDPLQVRFCEAYVNGTTAPNYVGFKAPASITGNTIWTLPGSDGSSGEVLQTNGSGVLSWISRGSGSPGGNSATIQFNDGAGGFDGSDFFVWDDFNAALTVKDLSNHQTLLIDPGNSNYAIGNIEGAYGTKVNIDDAGYTIEHTAAATNLLPAGTSAGNTQDLRFYELVASGSNYTGFKSPDALAGNVIYTLPTADGTSGQILKTNGSGTLAWIAADSGTVTSIATSNGLTGGTITGTGTISGINSAADGTTKGVASFTAADFNSSSGLISIDYANGQEASSGQDGFLNSTDWSTFNNKVATSRTISTTSPLSGGGDLSTNRTLSIADAAADGTTKGAASFAAADFDASSGVISIDHTNLISLANLATVGTIGTGSWAATVIAGQYGGTGVANTGKTITLGNDFTTSGNFALTLTQTNTTNVTLPTTGTLATLAGTETLTNKSIVGTQLTGTSYTFAANNTGSTAAYTLQPYEDHPLATYAGTVTFNSSAPSSITSQQYAWSRIGNTVTLFFSIFYGTPGTTNTSAVITLPSDCPTPAVFAGAGDAASEYAFPISGARVEANMTGNPSAIRGGLRQNSSNNGWEVALIFGSVSAAQCQFTISYRTN